MVWQAGRETKDSKLLPVLDENMFNDFFEIRKIPRDLVKNMTLMPGKSLNLIPQEKEGAAVASKSPKKRKKDKEEYHDKALKKKLKQ